MRMKLAVILGLTLGAPSVAWSERAARAQPSSAETLICVAPGLQPFCSAATPAPKPPAAEPDTIPMLRPFVQLARGVAHALEATLPRSTATATRTSM